MKIDFEPTELLTARIYMEGQLDGLLVDSAESEVPGPDHVYSATLSSDRPVQMAIGGGKVTMVLDHSSGAVDMGRIAQRAPILVNHDATKIAGHVVDAKLTGSQLFIDFKLSGNTLGREEALLISEGSRHKMSVGAEVGEMEVEQAEGSKDAIVRVTKWEPVEASLASIPRNVDATILQTIEGKLNIQLEGAKMPNDDTAGTVQASPQVDINQVRESARQNEITRIREITELGRQHDAVMDAQQYVAEGKSADDFRWFLLDRMADDPNEPTIRRATSEDANIGMSARELARFDWGRAIRALSFPEERIHQEAAAFEFECSRAAQAKMGVSSGGILIPNDVLQYAGGATRPGEGQEWVAEDKRGFIDNLRNRSALMQLNPLILTGLIGNLSIRKKTGSSTAYWTAEGSSSTQSTIASGSVDLVPHRLTVETAYDKQLLVQTDPSVNAVYERDMVETAALEFDRAALYGSGAANQPTGLVGQGITKNTDYTAPGPTWPEVVNLETSVASVNADVGSLAYLMAAAGRGYLKSNPKFASGDTPMWEPNNTLNGYNVAVSNQVTADQYWYGNWGDLIMAQWGGIDLTANPYIRTAYNEVVLYLMMYVDIGVRHAESFAYVEQAP